MVWVLLGFSFTDTVLAFFPTSTLSWILKLKIIQVTSSADSFHWTSCLFATAAWTCIQIPMNHLPKITAVLLLSVTITARCVFGSNPLCSAEMLSLTEHWFLWAVGITLQYCAVCRLGHSSAIWCCNRANQKLGVEFIYAVLLYETVVYQTPSKFFSTKVALGKCPKEQLHNGEQKGWTEKGGMGQVEEFAGC